MKSNVSDYLELAELIYIDATAKCIADVSDLRDLETIRSRVKSEGLSFLTITLPNFARDFEQALANGHIDSTSFQGFAKLGSIPRLFGGMTSQLFNRETGGLYGQRPDYCNDYSSVVDCVRQICLTFKKLELDCAPNRVQSSLSDYVKIEQSFGLFSLPERETIEFSHVSRLLWDNLVGDIRLCELRPRHGPGTTAEGISGNQKYSWRKWHERIEPYFPLLDNAYSNSVFGSEELEIVTFIKPEEEQPVKVTPVPKTLKGPRIIAIEPVAMQYAQQAIAGSLIEILESSEISAGHVNFTDQSINQRLALIASKEGHLATIDLSEASDRVPRDLALLMFQSNPDLRDAIDACRSTHAKLPDGLVIGPLRKFASMGSALCFPVESMYFYTISVAALLSAQNLPATFRNAYRVSRNVYVYGDDIIVPSKYATVVLDYLQKYNCKVNVSKTFYSGKFRESCGTDAYDGQVVTPTYLRQTIPESKLQVQNLISWVKTANLFYLKGYWRTSWHMLKTCERYLGPLPYVSEKSSVLGRLSFLGYQSIGRWNRKYHSFEIKGWVPSPVYRTDKLEGYAALQKSLTKLSGLQNLDMSRDALHLERSARYRTVALKLRWVPAIT